MPHRIRLRGPWEFDSLTHAVTRRFHQPTGLTSTSRVWLVIVQADSHARVDLNGQNLGEVAGSAVARFEITAQLQPNNLIAIRLTEPGEFIGQVSLEIEEPTV